MSNVEWDSKTVIGSKGKTAKVTRTTSDLNAVCARRVGAVVATDKKTNVGNKVPSVDHQKIAKLDRDNEVAPPSKVAPSVGKAIQQGRMDKGISQKDLAQKVNEKPSVVQDYESGKAIPNVQVLAKLERAIGVKLRGSNIGAKLEGPKKS